MKSFTEPLRELQTIEELEKHLWRNKGFRKLSGCIDADKAHLMHTIGGEDKSRLIVTHNEARLRELYEDMLFFDRESVCYPAKDILFFHADLHGNELTRQRISVLKAALTKKAVTIVTTFDALMNLTTAPECFQGRIRRIRPGDTLDLTSFENELVAAGYERDFDANMPGLFAVRGGILDIFPLTEETPIRIELFGDEVDSLRSFDAETQRSLENMEEAVIYPAAEEEAGKAAGTLLSYLDTEHTVIFLDEPVRLVEKGRTTETEFRESMGQRLEKGIVKDGEAADLRTVEQTIAALARFACVALSTLDRNVKEIDTEEHYELSSRSINAYNNSFELLTRDLRNYKRSGYRVILLSGSRTRAEHLAEDLRNEELNAFYTEDYDHEVKPGETMVLYGKVRQGYEYPLIKFVVITETDIFGAEKKRRKKKRPRTYEGERIASFSELSVGDYVVHENHGLGIYRGIEKVEVEKKIRDYIKIEYAGGGNLYILATQLDMIQKYALADAKKPKLNRLGGQEWKNTKTRVRSAVREIARELVELYATRQQQEGYVFGPDTVWQREFEEMFPFEETEDQESAIAATKHDMESTKIMDRLICGDVGYGKTEVAIRAAFKAVQEGKQVAYLVPTTILAQQHYNTFLQRMKDFPVRIELLCRFRTPAEQKKTVAELAKGQVDIVIGTHRLLSKDVQYKDLGLLIIDEEQRFGVAHKEKIKQLKKNVDVLTLTATPIPRTLHMSLIGIRDMSILEEPPLDRVPIQTYVMEYNEEMVREAINREIARGGQVYYVFNRVKLIPEMTAKIASLVPDAVVEYAHGKMPERELEDIMYRFINREIDVLVSTTIIETGLDIGNVNTMIVHDADNMGLSQLYQLRGRVGRSNRTAYAFLMYRRDKMLREIAEKRLAAIREFTDLGSGFRIAMRDLEIRGAGNLLGAEQSGHMEAVGYDLYCKLLNEAVKAEKGEAEEKPFDTTIDIVVDAFIPNDYIVNEVRKMDFYKRIAGIENEAEAEDMTEELIDRFGDPPESVLNLIRIAKLRAKAHEVFLTEVAAKGKRIEFVFYERAEIDVTRIPAFVEKYDGDLTFRADRLAPYFVYEERNNRGRMGEVLAFCDTFLGEMRENLLENGICV